MKDYSKMSDFEINKAVALSLGIEVVEWNGKIFGGVERKIDNVTSVIGVIDYCNNPSDAWPLIESNLICLMADVFCEPQDGGKWIAQPAYGWQHERVRNDNPLRAAMIMYLMMKDGEK